MLLFGSSVVQFKSFIYSNRHSTIYTSIANYDDLHPIRTYADENLYRYYDSTLRQKKTTDASILVHAKLELTDRRNWLAVFWLMQKLVIGLVSLVSVAVLYLTPFAFLLAPILYRYIDMNVIFMQVDTFAKSLLIMVLGAVLAAISVKLGDRLAKTFGGYTRTMIQQLDR